MTYELVAKIAQQGGLIYFGLIFVAGTAYALRPSNSETFRNAARLPLEEDEEPIDDRG
jgi:cytochrome c oxidase cbb3-type subunit 4